jgi:hypothetical protein
MSFANHLLALVILNATMASASETFRIVRVPGSATRTVAPDRVSIVFQLPTESESFSLAEREGAEVIALIRQVLPDSCKADPNRHDLIVIQQERVAWHSKGKKLEHRFEVVCSVGEDSVRIDSARIVDAVLPLHKKLTVVEMAVALSRETEIQVERELLAEAARDAFANARAAADGTGSAVDHVRAVIASPTCQPTERKVRYEQIGVLTKGRGPFRVRDPFSVESDVSAAVTYQVDVEGEFALAEP